jgi:hypothetical protein
LSLLYLLPDRLCDGHPVQLLKPREEPHK